MKLVIDFTDITYFEFKTHNSYMNLINIFKFPHENHPLYFA